ncbi:MAG: ATP-dependent Clp protease adaptor ClpS [Elusimicrobia bacterium]|nr:ATP-dependent Clp protease adaptor ClpS [Elusimicrobiota bacterium]
MPVAARGSSAQARGIEKPVDAGLDSGWRVILFNCDCHTFEQVEGALIKAVRCSLAQARAFSWEVHSKGSAVVYRGARERCEAVADVLGRVGLQVKVSR